jgi:hypothetical protein
MRLAGTSSPIGEHGPTVCASTQATMTAYLEETQDVHVGTLAGQLAQEPGRGAGALAITRALLVFALPEGRGANCRSNCRCFCRFFLVIAPAAAHTRERVGTQGRWPPRTGQKSSHHGQTASLSTNGHARLYLSGFFKSEGWNLLAQLSGAGGVQ